MAELTTRRAYLLAAIRADGRPVTTHTAVQLMDGSPWPTTGRQTARKDLRALAARGHLVPDTDTDTGRRVYHPTNHPEGRPHMGQPATPMYDHERVLGQIERGEVRANADAAREIATRHEDAYGDAFVGTPAEALRRQLWAAAVASLDLKDAA